MTLRVGTRLGAYEILAPVGAVGGEVFKARDTRLGRLVALKLLAADKVADPLRRQRFLQEAHAASALNHWTNSEAPSLDATFLRPYTGLSREPITTKSIC